jgi:hypothetical protein
MNKKLYLTLFKLVISINVLSQISPKENSTLNYRIIGFTFPSKENVNDYWLEIASGNILSEDSFEKKVILSLHSRTNRMIAEVPAFGEKYTWRVSYTVRHSNIVNSSLYHFSTGKVPTVDTFITRLRILKNTAQYMHSYVFLDGCMVLYDMKGCPVWYLPETNITALDPGNHRDLKITDQGTITFITARNAYEINYDGKIVWTAPNDGKVSGDSLEYYHHEFTRLSNGHYMIMGTANAPVYLKTSFSKNKIDSSLFIGHVDKTAKGFKEVYKSMAFGTVIEYDEKGKVVWSYNTARYFTGSDLIHHRYSDGGVDLKQHDNGFYFDENTKSIYISFKDFSRIIKVKYPEGTTQNTYGKLFKPNARLPVDNNGRYVPGAFQKGNGMFCNQHCCRCSKKGYLYVFNNNVCNAGSLPTLVVMQQPVSEKDTLKKVWEYDCEIEKEDEGNRSNINFSSGGNVEELPDGSFFASMSSGYSKIFIVNLDKEILWSAMSEKWNSYERKWEMISQYRASIITNRMQLERLIWGNKFK